MSSQNRRPSNHSPPRADSFEAGLDERRAGSRRYRRSRTRHQYGSPMLEFEARVAISPRLRCSAWPYLDQVFAGTAEVVPTSGFGSVDRVR